MNDQTLRQVAYYKRRIALYPEHPRRVWMEEQIQELGEGIEYPPVTDKIMLRSETLIGSIEKLQTILQDNPEHPHREKFVRLINEYQGSLYNIKEFGTENPRAAQINATKIEVPAHVMKLTTEI